jgi:hypothetical protein
MFKVTGSDGQVWGLVDTRAAAEAIVEMKKLGRDGRKLTNPSQATKVSTMTFTVSECPDSVHPGFVKR